MDLDRSFNIILVLKFNAISPFDKNKLAHVYFIRPSVSQICNSLQFTRQIMAFLNFKKIASTYNVSFSIIFSSQSFDALTQSYLSSLIAM